MKPYEERLAEARSYHTEGLENVKNNPVPAGQKFKPGTRVKTNVDKRGTVLYTYAHAYGGDDCYSYCLDVDGEGEAAWFDEEDLTLI